MGAACPIRPSHPPLTLSRAVALARPDPGQAMADRRRRRASLQRDLAPVAEGEVRRVSRQDLRGMDLASHLAGGAIAATPLRGGDVRLPGVRHCHAGRSADQMAARSAQRATPLRSKGSTLDLARRVRQRGATWRYVDSMRGGDLNLRT